MSNIFPAELLELMDTEKKKTGQTIVLPGELQALMAEPETAEASAPSVTPQKAQDILNGTEMFPDAAALSAAVEETPLLKNKDRRMWNTEKGVTGNLFVPLASGAARVANTGTLGVGGTVAGKFGQMRSRMDDISREYMGPLMKSLGFSDEDIDKTYSEDYNLPKQAGQWLLNKANEYNKDIGDWERSYTGEDPSFAAEVADTVGNQGGFLLARVLYPFLGEGLEALHNAADTTMSAAAKGQYEEGLNTAPYVFGSKLAQGYLLDKVAGLVAPWTNKIKAPWLQGVLQAGTEIPKEILDEALDNVNERTAERTANQNGGFLDYAGNLLEEGKKLPQDIKDVAATVGTSTALTSLLGLLGLKLKNQRAQARQDAQTQAAVDNAQGRSNLDKALGMAGAMERAGQAGTFTLDEMLAGVRGEQAGQKGKSLSSESSSPTSAPAPTPIPSATAQAKPEFLGDRQRYGDSDSATASPKRPKRGSTESGPVSAVPLNEDTISQPEAEVKEPAKGGNIARVRTAAGTEVETRYRVMEADSLIASNTETGAVNPDYPQELQPRQRDREASRRQINRIANNLDPELLGENRMASDGAPIVGADRVVESGNGRVLAIRQAYRTGGAENYRTWLKENAGRFGLDGAEIDGIKNPVLVRERTGEIDRAQFAREANEASVSRMSPTEQAKADAARMTPEMLAAFDPDRPIQNNREFIQMFADGIVGKNDMGNFMTSDGQLSQEGLQRMTHALFAKAYGNTGALNRLSESLDDETKSVTGAMVQAAPRMAALENAVEGGGAKPELSLKDDVSAAANTLAQLRKDGTSVEEYLQQVQMFSDDEISPEAKRLLSFFNRYKRSAKKITTALNRYAELAMNEGAANQGALFDTGRDKRTLLNEAIKYAQDPANYGQGTLFDEDEDKEPFRIEAAEDEKGKAEPEINTTDRARANENNARANETASKQEKVIDKTLKKLTTKQKAEEMRQKIREGLIRTGESEDKAEETSHVIMQLMKSTAAMSNKTLDEIAGMWDLDFVKGGESGAGENYWSPMYPNVNKDTLVPLVDLNNSFAEAKNLRAQDLLTKLKGLIQKGDALISSDSEVFMHVVGKKDGRDKARHLSFGSQKEGGKGRQTRNAAINSIEELAQEAVAVAWEPNTKKQVKPDVENYHYLVVPAEIDGKAYAVCLVMEELTNGDGLRPVDVELYDVIVKKSNVPLPPSATLPNGSDVMASRGHTVRLGDVVKNVKYFVDKGIVFKQIIGERGAAKLDAADAGNRIDNLGVAREMEQAGKDARTIWLATGWQRGKEGKWNYDLMDGEVKLPDFSGLTEEEKRQKTAIYEKFKKGDLPKEDIERFKAWTNKHRENVNKVLKEENGGTKAYKLGDIYDAPELYNAYPDLKDTKVYFRNFEDDSQAGGYGYGRIFLNASYLWQQEGKNEIKSTLVHEIQHAIQRIEGFAVGGNEKSSGWAAMKKYADLSSQIEALERRQRELPHASEIEMGYLEDILALDTLPEEDVAAYDAITEELGKLERQRASMRRMDNFEAYRRLAGETQARNASARMEMTAEERRQKLLSETEDVSREDQIVLMDALGVSESREDAASNTRAYTEFQRDAEGHAKAIIHMLENADASSGIHEGAHVYLDVMKRLADAGDLNEEGRAVWEALNKELAVEKIGWHNAQEKFAASVEKYLMTGEAPTSGLKRVFEAFKKWLGEIYHAVRNITWTDTKGREHRFNISKGMRETLDTIFSAGEQGAENAAIEREIQRGTRAMEHVLKKHTDVMHAMKRPDLGEIAFIWGNKGAGIAHILENHVPDGVEPKEFLGNLIDTIASGELGEEYSVQNGRKQRINITKGPYTVVLGKEYNGDKVNWVVTGWDERVPDKRKPNSDTSDKGQDFSDATLSETTSSVTEREQSEVSEDSVPQNEGTRKAETQAEDAPDFKPANEKEAKIHETLKTAVEQGDTQTVAETLNTEDNPFTETTEPKTPPAETTTGDTEENIRFENEETERRFAESRRSEPKFEDRLVRGLANGEWRELKKAETESGERMAPIRVAMRLLARKVKTAPVTASETLKHLNGLDRRQFDIFARKRMLDNLMWRKEDLPDADLPWGLTAETLKKEHERFTRLAEKDPRIMEAIEREEAEQAKINAKFAGLAEALGWHDLAKKLRNPHYFHHEILFDGDGGTKSDGKSREAGGTGLERLVNTIRGRGYLQKYKGSLKDICANYALVTAGVRAQMLQDIAIMETLGDIKEKYDKAGELRKTLKPGEKLSDVVPEGYAVYDPLGGGLVETGGGANMETLIAMAAEQTAEEAETLAKDLMGPDIYKQSGLRGDIANKITEMLAARGNQLMVIPKELKAVLTRAAEKRKTNKFMRALYKLTHGWKLWTLYSPFRTIKYNLRNLSGDMDALLAGNPRAYKKVGRSIKDLVDVMFRGKEAEGDIRDYMERGWAQSTESHNLMDDGQLTFRFDEEEIQRLIDLQKQAEAGKLNWKGLGKKSLKLLNKYSWGGIQHLTEFREQILRYACYLSYKEQMEADLKRGGEGRPDNWGASLKEEVMAVRDIRDRAYKMANELMGAYDQVSETGQKLRRFAIPFYSWLEVNARRYWRLLKNGLTSDSRKDFVAGFMKGTGMKAPLYAYRVARTYAMVNLFSIAMKLFNMGWAPEADDDLPPEVQQKPHITLGRDKDGNILYFDRLGSTADVMDWIGEDEALLPFVSTVKDILNGQQTVTGWIRQMGSAAYSKAFNALSPALKMPMEIATGKTYYPDATNPRMIRDMVDYAASTVGLSREVRALRGEPGPKYAEGVLDWLGQHASYAADPEEGAYFHILDRVRQFQERELGKTFDGAAITRRGEALRKLKTALRFNDKANVKRYLKEYYKLGGTRKGLKTSLDRMGPLAGLSREEQKQFLRWLPKEERKYLTKANQYYRELRSSLARL